MRASGSSRASSAKSSRSANNATVRSVRAYETVTRLRPYSERPASGTIEPSAKGRVHAASRYQPSKPAQSAFVAWAVAWLFDRYAHPASTDSENTAPSAPSA